MAPEVVRAVVQVLNPHVNDVGMTDLLSAPLFQLFNCLRGSPPADQRAWREGRCIRVAVVAPVRTRAFRWINPEALRCCPNTPKPQ